MVDILAGQIRRSETRRGKKRAMVAVSTMIGALTVSRVVTISPLDTILRNAEDSITGSQTWDGRKAKNERYQEDHGSMCPSRLTGGKGSSRSVMDIRARRKGRGSRWSR